MFCLCEVSVLCFVCLCEVSVSCCVCLCEVFVCVRCLSHVLSV